MGDAAEAPSDGNHGEALVGQTVTMVATPEAECSSGVRAGDAVIISQFEQAGTHSWGGVPQARAVYHLNKGSFGAGCTRAAFKMAGEGDRSPGCVVIVAGQDGSQSGRFRNFAASDSFLRASRRVQLRSGPRVWLEESRIGDELPHPLVRAYSS